ncbi:MAG: hypothetical protein HY300_09640, partial [Verrucomicrobia bacterium]|nr:hypothetical protein [Verrucomicrobiota bacterium]
DETSRDYLKAVADSSTHMGRLIDDLLEFSRMGRTELQQTWINFSEMIKAVLAEFRAEVKARKINWTIDPLPDVRCDPSLLRQVWANLVSNALKYTRTRDETRIHIGFTEEGAELVFFIRDNGVGFDMNYAKKLFGVFQRLHRPSEFEGTGVGLANVRRIIQRHGGRTWAEGVVGSGATFYFALPKPTLNHDAK